MRNLYLNNLMSSFYLWLDNRILSVGEGFYNYSGKLYESYDPNYDGISSIYASPFRQWVYDESVSGALIPSGIYLNSNFIPKTTSGLAIDYNKGRAIFENNLIIGQTNLSAQYSYKEYNIFYTDEKEEKILFENAYQETSSIQGITGAIGYGDSPYPCVFIKNRFIENNPFAFGGQNKSTSEVRCIVLASNSFSLDSLISLSIDSLNKTFPVLSPEELPFNYLGDFKGSSFNYKTLCESSPMHNYGYIEKISVSKLEEIRNNKMNKKTTAAYLDFELSNIRYNI